MEMTNKARFYTWEINPLNFNEVMIYEQEFEDDNSYDCISHIVEQLLKENNQYNFHIRQ